MPISLRTDEVPHHLRRYFQPADGCGECYICHMVRVFRLVREVMAEHAVCWLNIGDSYAANVSGSLNGSTLTKGGRQTSHSREAGQRKPAVDTGNLCLIPWRLALALQADGWVVRSVIVWHKPAPMPASLAGWMWKRCRVKVKSAEALANPKQVVLNGQGGRGTSLNDWDRPDKLAQWSDCPGCRKCDPHGGYVLRRGSWRPTSAWEPVLLLAKSARYYADGIACQQIAAQPSGVPKLTGDQSKSAAGGVQRNGIGGSTLGTNQGAAFANLRDVWTISSEPLGSVVIPKRHVVSSDEADGGTVHILSEDCPVHGRPRAVQTTNKALCDEPEASPSPRKVCSDARPSSEPSGGDERKRLDSARSPGETSGPSRRQTDRGSSKTCGHSSEDADTRETADGTAGTSPVPVENCNPGGSPSAKRHSNPCRKKARAPRTSVPSISCERTTGRTERTQAEPLSVGTPQSTPESKIELPDSAENRTPQTDADTVDRQQEPHACEPSVAPDEKRCTCLYYRETKQKIDHYAAFPTELVHRCLKAGTSARGYCPSCGAPWARVVESERSDKVVERMRNVGGREDGFTRTRASGGLPDVQTVTLDWRQTCTCPPHDPRPARVLDPFCGSSRVGVEALRLGMDFTGIDLNPQYVEMSKRILRNESPLFSGVS